MLTFQKYVHFMRTQFPPGSRVLLLSNDQPKPVPDGAMGTLTEVDAAGRFLVNWDTGKRTALNLEDDHFRIFQPELMELKLYFPLHGDLYTRNEWGDLADDPVELTGGDLSPYLGDIREALQENQLPEEQERGLMHWYGKSDALSWKVKSAFFDVELHDGQLWGVADCQLLESLEGDELGRLTTYLAGQASDGWGEGFEQRDIRVDDGTLAVHFWQDHDFELKRDVPDMTEFNKLLNRPKKPKMQLIGQDGNIFAIMGRAAKLLRENGQNAESLEMRRRVTHCDNYYKALGIISEYVETELSVPRDLSHDPAHIRKEKKRGGEER